MNGNLWTTTAALGLAASLHKAQHAWRAHRTAACNLEAGGLAGDSARPMVDLPCITRMIKTRRPNLSNWLLEKLTLLILLYLQQY